MPDHEELEQLLQNREKVMRGLECCVNSAWEAACPESCPYYDNCTMPGLLVMIDALELLKEVKQE